ncbi:hypothetical protein MYCTH_2299035 [Thermothelomyces thermophilus ATCC 42464]|uniref:Uncharacterized protein n=1 Tax=Thermothelomyces thermophilus (strain ATCC 42464 / BCRC 31852 / DSM 1799) TaxID=573729 RepID=G2Q4D2_THET4|nr:uncharacterized protein MYCTH_2299035 [Thermothelomyces thermophilus ATCC 42464]AEO55327.1 hypothetical protein MYCTH_2299035 [Thermothelomyces thermophilus ATCC 42464]
MGLLSFISKKTVNRGKAGASVVSAQPLESASSQTPHPQDESAVVADDSRMEGSPSGVRAGSNQSELSLGAAAAEDEQPAPTPNVPRLREEDTGGLGAAENDRHSRVSLSKGMSRAKGSGRGRPPPLSFRITKTDGVPTSRPSSRGSMGTVKGPVNRNSGRVRAESLRTNNSSAFKDLLDAQSEIKPADFRERVTAAGARDYGEDVADRNLGQNGFDLSSEHVRAFYAQMRRAESQHAGHLTGTKKLDPYKAGVRRISPCASQPSLSRDAYGSTSSSNSRSSRKEDSARRRSVSTYMPLSLGKVKSLPFDRKHEHLGALLSPRTPVPEDESLDFGFSAPRLNTPVVPQIPDTAPSPTIRTARRPRDSVELAKRRAEAPVPEDGDADDSPTGNFALWSAARPRRSSAILSASSPSKKYHSLHTLHSSALSTVSRETLRSPASFPLEAASKNLTHIATEIPVQKTSVRPEVNDDQKATASPTFRARTIPEDDRAHPLRKPHLLASKEESRAADITLPDDDILDYAPPIRTDNIRKWSASSGTPTACESSTAASIVTSTFNRPPSLHTADTSVDLSIGTISPPLKPTKPQSATHDSDSDVEPYYNPDLEDKVHNTVLPAPRKGPPEATETASDTFNIDDYVSSDAESLMRAPTSTTTTAGTTSSRQPTAEGEEELLFKDNLGFGPGGMQLPGLADPLPSSPAPRSPLEPVNDVHESQKEFGIGEGGRRWDRYKCRGSGSGGATVSAPYGAYSFVHDTPGWGEDYPVRRSAKRVEGGRRREIRRLSALGHVGTYDGSASEYRGGGNGGYGDKRRERGGMEAADDHDDGYDADYIDEDEELSRRQLQRAKQTRRQRLEGCEKESRTRNHHQGGENQPEQQQQQHDEGLETQIKITNAVRLRKQARRARMLSGQPSAAMLRRKGPTSQGSGKRLSVPVLEVEGEE